MKKLAVFCCLLLTMSASSALASMSGTLVSNKQGGIDTSGGMTGINAIIGDLTWTVDQLDGGLWEYSYNLVPHKSTKTSGAGSLNLEFGATPTYLSTTYDFSGAFASSMDTATTDGIVKTVDRTAGAALPSIDGYTYPEGTGPNNSWTYDSWLDANNPGTTSANVTSTFDGMEWLFGDGTSFFHLGSDKPGGLTLTVTTDLAPMWGNIYFDGFNETTNNGYGMLRNTNYDIDPDTVGEFAYLAAGFDYASSAFVGWVATPGAAAVPVPASLLLFGSGLAGLFIFKRRSMGC